MQRPSVESDQQEPSFLKEIGALCVELDRLPAEKNNEARDMIADALVVGFRPRDIGQLKQNKGDVTRR